jgi:hypothetical protein
MQSDLILEFREQGFHLFSFPLCLRELWCVDQLASAVPGRLIDVNGEILITGRFLRFSGYVKLGFGGAHTESNQRLMYTSA